MINMKDLCCSCLLYVYLDNIDWLSHRLYGKSCNIIIFIAHISNKIILCVIGEIRQYALNIFIYNIKGDTQ